MLSGERWRRGGDLRVAATRVGAVGAAGGAVALAIWATVNYVSGGGVGMDSHAYWLAGRVAHPYRVVPGGMDAFLYSPLFAQTMRPLALLPWPLFCATWAIVMSAVAWWLTGPLPWRWRVAALAVCWTEVLTGNIDLVLAATLVLAVRGRASLVAVGALTKILPVAVLGIWWVGGRRWRELVGGACSTVLLAGLSFAVEPHLWREWAAFLWSHRSGQAASPLRLLTSVLVAAWAARVRDPRWLALALWLSLPMAQILEVQPAVALLAAVRLPGPVARGVSFGTRRLPHASSAASLWES